MSFVHPLSAMGQPLREDGPRSLRDLAAESVARTMAHVGYKARQEYQEFEDLKGGLDGAFQLARADAIAQQAAAGKKNKTDQEYITAYEDVMFSPPTSSGPVNGDGLTAQLRTRKRLMQPDLRDMYFAKVQRRSDRRKPRWEPLPEAMTPVDAQGGLATNVTADFAVYAADYLKFDLPARLRRPHYTVNGQELVEVAARELGLPFETTRRLLAGATARYHEERWGFRRG